MRDLNFSRALSHRFVFLSVLAGLPAVASAQIWETEPLLEVPLGAGSVVSVSSIGDLDGDGLNDGLIGAVAGNADPGRVVIVSSGTGAILVSLDGLLPGDSFGNAVAGCGDLDGDGVPDFFVGASATNTNRPGAVSAHSGVSGVRLWTVDGNANGDRFGLEVSRLGDVTGDGIDDVCIGAPGVRVGALLNIGSVSVHSGVDGTLIRSWLGTESLASFGFGCGSAGDVNGDGFDDQVVCDPAAVTNGVGEATVYSGADGAVLWRVSAPLGSEQYGVSGAGVAGDVNADGVDDIYVIDTWGQDDRGRLFVYSGVDGALLHSILGAQENFWMFGQVAIGDLDRDGYDDLAVCSSWNNTAGLFAGAVSFYSGATGMSMGQFSAAGPGLRLGTDCVSMGDLTGNGREDLLVGVGGLTSDPNTGGGGYFLATLPAPPLTYCEGEPNSTGVAGELSVRGSQSLGSQGFATRLRGLPPGSLAVVFGGPDALLEPAGDGLRCIGDPAARLGHRVAGNGGQAQIALDIPTTGPAAAVAGVTWHIQSWYRDLGAIGSSFNLTSAIRLTFRD